MYLETLPSNIRAGTSMSAEKILRSMGTHDGTFHADEVTACALLLLFDLIDLNKIVRTRDSALLETCEYVCDVGGIFNPEQKKFDHHQADYRGQLSSAGMVLQYLRDIGKINSEEYEFFNNSLIAGVDAYDNGADLQIPGICTYSHVVSNFTPITYEVSKEVQNAAFLEALDFAYGHLKRLWDRRQYVQSSKQIVSDIMAKNGPALIFDKNLPWMDSFFALNGEHHPALFVIMPSGPHWKLRGIPPNGQDRMKVRCPLPEEWAGLSDEDLKETSGIKGAIFCHKGRFISVWETRQDAIEALNYILNTKGAIQ